MSHLDSMNPRTYEFHSDPGHGWLEVPYRDLFALGLKPQDFSVFSYKRSGVAFLEEDCDADIFLSAYYQQFGEYADIKETHHDDNRVRGLPSIRAQGELI